MTYVSDQKRWTKQHRGRTYSISCRQLACSPGKEASWVAANQWWEAKQAEIDAREAEAHRPDPANQLLQGVADGLTITDLRALIERGKAAAKVMDILGAASVHGCEAATVEVVPARTLPNGEVILAAQALTMGLPPWSSPPPISPTWRALYRPNSGKTSRRNRDCG